MDESSSRGNNRFPMPWEPNYFTPSRKRKMIAIVQINTMADFIAKKVVENHAYLLAMKEENQRLLKLHREQMKELRKC